MVKEHNQIFVALLGMMDLAVSWGAWVGCYYLRFHSGLVWPREAKPPSLAGISDVVVISLLLTLLVFTWNGLYRPRRMQAIRGELFDLVKACIMVWGLQVVLTHFLKSAPLSRRLQGMYLVSWPVLMVAWRGSARAALRAFRRHGRNRRSATIIGTGKLAQKLRERLGRETWTGYNVLYWVDDANVGGRFLGIPVYGPIQQAGQLLAQHPVDAVFVALPRAEAERLPGVLAELPAGTVDVNLVPDFLHYPFLGHDVRQFGTLAVVNLTHSPQSGWSAAVKRLCDVAFSLTAIALLSPLMLAIAAAVKLTSGGPVLYRQRRASLGGREFTMLKFRSMVRRAEEADGPVWGATVRDPRVTTVGRVLRKLSLDELPQLLNVVRGDMSLVGPRPERPEFIQRFRSQVSGYMLRHHVRAGMTGWAQVNGYRGRSSLRKRIQYDLDYINRWSLGFDLRILVLTVFRGFINPSS